MFSFIFAWLGSSGDSSSQGNPLLMLVPWLLIIFIIYFLMIRPQVKRQKKQKEMVDSLQKGDKVTAAGGILGTIAGIRDADNVVILKVDKDLKIEVLRSSVSAVFKKDEDGS